MILEMLLDVIYNILDLLLILDIPNMPTEALSYIDTAFDYLVAGAGVLANYTPLPYLLVLLGVVIAVDMGIMIYHFIMWIIKKIPMLGIE